MPNDAFISRLPFCIHINRRAFLDNSVNVLTPFLSAAINSTELFFFIFGLFFLDQTKIAHLKMIDITQN